MATTELSTGQLAEHVVDLLLGSWHRNELEEILLSPGMIGHVFGPRCDRDAVAAMLGTLDRDDLTVAALCAVHCSRAQIEGHDGKLSQLSFNVMKRLATTDLPVAAQTTDPTVQDTTTTPTAETYSDGYLKACLDFHMKSSSQNMGLIYLDIRGLDSINNRLGRAAGDAVIEHVGRDIRDCLRPEDVTARVQGDEFVAAFSPAVLMSLSSIAQRLMVTIDGSEVAFNGHEIPVGISIGGLLIQPEQFELNDAEEFIGMARNLMRTSRLNGCDVPEILTAADYRAAEAYKSL